MNVPHSWLTEASVVFNCKISHIPFVYFGLPIGGDHNRLNFWQLLVDRNKKKCQDGKVLICPWVFISFFLNVLKVNFNKAL